MAYSAVELHIYNMTDGQCGVKRQEVLERLDRQTIGDQRGPLRFYEEEFRRDGRRQER